MTLQYLTDYYTLQTQIREYERLTESLRAAAESMTPALSDMPKSSYLQERLSRFVALIVDIDGRLEILRPDAEERRARIAVYVEGLDDLVVKTIVSLRFLELMSWSDVAKAIGGGNSDDSVRILCQRYLERGE